MKSEVLLNTPDIIKGFLVYSEAIKDKSKLSVEEYFLDLQTFFRYLKKIRSLVDNEIVFEKIDISDITIELVKTVTLMDLYTFLLYCKNERGNNTATRARKCSTLKIYFKYLTNNVHLLESNPAELLEAPKIKQSLPKYLSLNQSVDLLESVSGAYEIRDYCILILFLNCGLRLSELCNINLSDIKDDGTLRITGKGNKQRIVYLNEACKTAIKKYMAVRPVDGLYDDAKNALFISRLLKRISNKTVQYIVYKTLENAGLSGQGLSVHKLRHTAATLMYQHGNVDIMALKEILGHENLGTTQIYTHISNNQIQTAINANPLAKIKKKK